MQEMQHRMLFLIISSSALSLWVGNATIIEREEEEEEEEVVEKLERVRG